MKSLGQSESISASGIGAELETRDGGPAGKVKSVAEIAAIAARCRAEGRRVVLAHGVFDLLHIGHIRHLQEARKYGDVLVVTITADQHVNKGPDRPVFTQSLRAEMLANLAATDWVAINQQPTSQSVILEIKPDFYVKGSEYANAADDVTGGIIVERQAVEAGGGKLVFTDDVVFSSSTLINRYLGVQDDELRQYLNSIRETVTIDAITASLDKLRDVCPLIVGDAIVDEYRYVTPLGKAQKENMIATLLRNSEAFAGGVLASANHMAEFCREVELITCIGEDESYEDMIRGSLKKNVKLTLLRRPGKPTTCKTRFVDPGYMRKLFEVYRMDDTPVGGELEERLLDLITSKAREHQCVVVNDFGHGLITSKVVDRLQEVASFLAVNAQTNSANIGYNLITKYRRADYVCIDAPEARLAAGDKFSDIDVIASERLPSLMNCPKMIITHGALGAIAYDKDRGLHRIPVFTKSVVDTVGAGDAFFAITSPLVAAGVPLEQAGFIGNAAGAIKVGIVGHRRSVERVPVIKFITALLK